MAYETWLRDKMINDTYRNLNKPPLFEDPDGFDKWAPDTTDIEYYFEKRTIKGKVRKIAYSDLVYITISSCRSIFKIGITNNPKLRISQLNHASPILTHSLMFIFKPITQNDARKHERHLHAMLKDRNLKGEWFRLFPEDITAATEYLQTNGYKLFFGDFWNSHNNETTT
jgi:hypothetical protein